MAKTTQQSKKPNDEKKAPASFASKDKSDLMPSKDNSSKFSPTKEADMDVQSLDPEDGLMKLLHEAVKDIYWAENQLVKSLPKMAKAAGSAELSTAIMDHLKQTEGHVDRLEQVFGLLGKKSKAKKCDAMEGLTKEGEAVIEETDMQTPARDLGIIMASQKVEHYEIAAYTGMSKLAAKLGRDDIAQLLEETLAEEIEADQLLASIAEKN